MWMQNWGFMCPFLRPPPAPSRILDLLLDSGEGSISNPELEVGNWGRVYGIGPR